MSESNGWEKSAAAWIADMGEHGDFGRRYVLDPVMLPRALARTPSSALDVGCGEGRFCRMLRAHGVDATGIDPTRAMIKAAQERDPDGRYVEARAEAIPFEDDVFDLVIAYNSLIDIQDVPNAIAEMTRVLRPGGALLIANLNGFNTAGGESGWVTSALGKKKHYPVDDYLRERSFWTAWRGIRIVNHHRPLSTYMRLLLAQRLVLTHFDEPASAPDAPTQRAADYVRAPWFLVMEWKKVGTQSASEQ